MNPPTSSPPTRLEHALADPTLGVVGLVDELRAAALERDVRLDWHEGRCRVALGDDPGVRLEVGLPKSVVRGALARIAALCNEHEAGSVSPHGGQGRLAFGPGHLAAIGVAFVNVPGAQTLELARVGWAAPVESVNLDSDSD